MKRGVEGTRPVAAEGVPAEEGVDQADVADRIDEDPDEQVNRTEQPDALTPGEQPIAGDSGSGDSESGDH